MQLSRTDNQFIFTCDPAQNEVARKAGFMWNRKRGFWYTTRLAVAVKLRQYGSETLRDTLNRLYLIYDPWLLPLPPPPSGFQLMPHQAEAVYFGLDHNRCYLGLDPGLGKTAVTAVIAETLKQPLLYVCPPFLVENVKEEFKRWAPNLSGFTILPDTMLQRLNFTGMEHDSGLLIVDEAHRFKNLTAKRSKALYKLASFYNRVVYMSGTPMPNRPIELYPVLSKSAPETIDFMSEMEYARKFCGAYRARFGWDLSGATNMQELQNRVIDKFMLRMKKELLKLPPKIEQIFVVSQKVPPVLTKMEKSIGGNYKSAEDFIKKAIAIKAGKTADDLSLASYRRLLGQAKVPSTVEYVTSLLEDTDENIIVFAYHKDVVAGLAKGLKEFKPYVITGQTDKKIRLPMVKEYQHSKDRRLLIGNYLALGIGFNITKVTRIVFCEFDYVPGNNQQASDRAHRIGQTNSVLVQYIVFKDSIDKKIIEIILKKQKDIAYV